MINDYIKKFLHSSFPTAVFAGTFKENCMNITETTNLSTQQTKAHEGLILPNTVKGRNRLFASNHASKRRNDNAMKRTAEKKEREKKAVERDTAKVNKEAQSEAAKSKKSQASVAIAAAAQKVMAEGDEIALKEAAYHDRYVKNANSDLYRLLQIIMAFVGRVIASKQHEGIKSSMRHKLKHTYQINTQKNTPTASIVVRYVTRTSRKNACVYARVINKALEDGVKSKDLIKYIEKHQGIDNIRKKIAPKEKEPVTMSQEELGNKKFLVDFGEHYLINRASSGKYMGKFKLPAEFSSTMIDATRFSNFKYFVCDRVGDEYVIVDVVPVDSDFEPVLFERISNYHLQSSVHKQEVADAMNAAVTKTGRKFDKPLGIAK